MSDDQQLSKNSRLEECLKALLKEIQNPLHKRLIQAYFGIDPVYSMETELGEILLEVVNSEDK